MRALDLEKTSSTVSVRVQIRNLATISNWMISNGVMPKSAGEAVAELVRLSTEMLINNRSARTFTASEAHEFLTKNCLMGGVKMNSRELKNQLSESSNRESFYIDPKTKEDVIAYHSYKMKCTELGVQELSPEEWKKKGRPFSPVDKCSVPDGFEFGEPEESIPSNEDELLSALEQGKPKLAE